MQLKIIRKFRLQKLQAFIMLGVVVTDPNRPGRSRSVATNRAARSGPSFLIQGWSPMRGVKCSWKEMQRLHREVLPALANGDGKKYSELRCLKPNTVSDWRRTSEVMGVLDEAEFAYANFENFQPSHARELSRHFRREDDKHFSDDTKEQIVDLVDQCEAEGWTVKQLRDHLKNGGSTNGNGHSTEPDAYTLPVALEKLNEAVRAVLERWPADCLETAGHKLVRMGNDILETGGLRE